MSMLSVCRCEIGGESHSWRRFLGIACFFLPSTPHQETRGEEKRDGEATGDCSVFTHATPLVSVEKSRLPSPLSQICLLVPASILSFLSSDDVESCNFVVVDVTPGITSLVGDVVSSRKEGLCTKTLTWGYKRSLFVSK